VYERVSELPLEVEAVSLERREAQVPPDFTRVTTTVVLQGAGEVGRGEDVTYLPEAHDEFAALPLEGRWTLDELSSELTRHELADFSRWGVESAALDLALRQAGLSLGAALGREYRPVRFVFSTRGDVRSWRELYPGLEFKLDPTADWDDDRIRELAADGRVRVLDLKGQYRGTPVDAPADARLYRALVGAFPDAIIEDPALTDETQEALRGAEDRISWDAPIHAAADIEARAPRYVNIKPSRFGSVRRLFDAIAYCDERGISMYGGGQFELGVGRRQIQVLASLFYPDAPNDVAPSDYNFGGPRPGLPESPLLPPDAPGF
jgi:hypothetical protein